MHDRGPTKASLRRRRERENYLPGNRSTDTDRHTDVTEVRPVRIQGKRGACIKRGRRTWTDE